MPAPVLTTGGLGDLVQTTLPHLNKPKFTEIATDIQDHTAMRNLLLQSRTVVDGGHKVQWGVMVNHANSSRNVGLGASDIINIVDTMVQATADWKNTTGSWAIIGQEIDFNREPARIINLIQERRIAAMISMAELMETNFWGPPVTSTDSETPWGVNTWIVKNATEGFNGAAPSGYTSIGLNPSTYTRWKNWTYQYSSVTRDDLIRHWRKAATFVKFKPPVDGIPSMNTGDKYGYYTNYSVIGQLEEALEAQNENLGADIASQDGRTLFRRIPVDWVPKLEADTTNPVYGINWGYFKNYVLSGWWLKETRIEHYPGQHTVAANFMDCTYQPVTTNRRAHFVLATGVTYPS